MLKLLASRIPTLLAGCLLATAVLAHVTVWPRESAAGAYEKYVVRVPTEGSVETTSIELFLPDNLIIVSMAMPTNYTYELKKTGERVSSIVWTQKIPPNEFAEFAFMARNPKENGPLVWRAVQHFADGSTTAWTGPLGDSHPASVTTISGIAIEHRH